MGFLLWQVCSSSCSLFGFKIPHVHFDPTSAGEIKGPHWQSSLYQCKATYSGMPPCFPEVPLKTHHPTPWGWGVGPRSPIYSETDLPQGQVPGYPPPADVPGSRSSLGNITVTTGLHKHEYDSLPSVTQVTVGNNNGCPSPCYPTV
jgi:hypothetical protein